MTFKQIIETYGSRLPLGSVASEAGVPEEQLRRALLEPEDPDYSPPPFNWRQAVASIAWEEGGKLHALALELEKQTDAATL